MMQSMINIKPEEFKKDLYVGTWWSVLGLTLKESMEPDKMLSKLREHALGYCEGSKISHNKGSNTYAYMFCKDGENYWTHIGKEEIEILNRYIKNN